jgi:peptidoglycan/xylan/chitin deacetylase (PgdA/CDA1 family)
MSDSRIAVFTGDLNYSVRKGITQIDRAIPRLSWLVVFYSPNKTASRVLLSQWRNLQRNGWPWIFYQTSEVLRRLLVRVPAESPPSVPGGEFTMEALRSRTNIQLLKVTDIRSADTLEAVDAFAPDLGLSLAAPILPRSLFTRPRLGTVNLHKGKLPDYRGMPPAFWELWNREKSVGCTVHWVDDHLDTGDLVCTTEVPAEQFSTVRGLQIRLDEVGVDLMREAVEKILRGNAKSSAQAPGGKTYRKPSLGQAAALDKNLRRGQRRSASTAKILLKDWVAGTAVRTLHVPWVRLAKPRITVLLFHRVSDSARDNLTVGIEQFDRQMALLHRRCEVLPIEEVITFTDVPRSKLPLVCVTFDDGYLDNYLNAVPILMRHGIPAAFFVSTGMIGTGRRFSHDIRRGNLHIPTMQWDHLREMRKAGFTIGSHSVSHIDCATEREEIVRDELGQSLADLRRELGLSDVLFAYPYGGRKNMTPQRLELVKQTGYSACLSAYGGVNVGKVDRYNVLRRGVHWEYTDRVFLFTCLGLK